MPASSPSVNGFLVQMASLQFPCERKAPSPGESAGKARFCAWFLRRKPCGRLRHRHRLQLSLQQSGPPNRRCTIKAARRLLAPAAGPVANRGSHVSDFHTAASGEAPRAPSSGQPETRAFQGTSAGKSVLLVRASPPGGCPQSHRISQWPRSTCG